MQRWNKICGVLFLSLFSSLVSNSQIKQSILYNPSSFKTFKSFHSTISADLKNENISTSSSPVKIINGDFYTQHFGFMCKQELALQKFSKLPLRIRLGSLQQCNYLEGKK